MPLSNNRIMALGQTPHLHEQEAIHFTTKELPDAEPYRLWALIDLVDASGRRYDLDLLILGHHALYLLAMKGYPGRVEGDVVDWRVSYPGGGTSIVENPLRLTNLKAKVLASQLERKLGQVRPWVQPLVFLSHDSVDVRLAGAAETGVVTRRTLIRALSHAEFPFADPKLQSRWIDKPQARRITEALVSLGLKPSIGALKLDDLLLGELLEEGTGYQDHLARHENIPGLERRVRSYVMSAPAGDERRLQLRRAAEREARHLTVLSDHRSVLRLVTYRAEGPTGGPCIVFEHFPDALPLDAFLRAHPLNLSERIRLLELIGEALEYCHRKKVLHRGLHPGSVLVRKRPEDGALEVRLYNFQLASQEDGSQGTLHLSALAPDQTAVYRAPEVIEDPQKATRASDLFSLGTIAYLVLTGRPPGTNLVDRHQLLAAGHLSVAAARDDLAGRSGSDDDLTRKSLDDVVAFATEVNPNDRADSAIAWVNLLLESVTAPAEVVPNQPDSFPHPLLARPGDPLSKEIGVVKILGSGSTAKVLHVRIAGAEYALKVALSPDLDERVATEGEVLKRLTGDKQRPSNDKIVALEKTLTLGERTCLLMTYGGESLADLLAREGPMSLDYARRWGDDLLQALEVLEDRAIQHRDIKPANLGVLTRETKKKRHLLLFDFSLSMVAPSAITAGTPAYRDPFLIEKGRGAWDEAADRYAAAITLHEMLTGSRPRWGDGSMAATATTEEHARVEAERFDASVRDRLVAFFRRALARDVANRFDSAERMRTDWQGCFATPGVTITPAVVDGADASEDQPAAAATTTNLEIFTPASSIEALPLSVRAKNALDRAGVITAGDLLRLPDNQWSAMRGVGRSTAEEILKFRHRLRPVLESSERTTGDDPQFVPAYRGIDTLISLLPIAGEITAALDALDDAGLSRTTTLAAASRVRVERILARFPGTTDALRKSLEATTLPGPTTEPVDIDGWLELLLPTARGRGQMYLKHVRLLFGLDEIEGERITDVAPLAKRLDVSRALLYQSLKKASEIWMEAGHPAQRIVAHVDAALRQAGGVASLRAVGESLAARIPDGSGATSDGSTRAVRAEALARIALESTAELQQMRSHQALWLGLSQDHLDTACALGVKGDELARRQPLPSSEEVRDSLAKVVQGTPLEEMPAERLVALAAEASENAARSARLELYPRGMGANRALTLSAGALPTARVLPETILKIVKARYPEAESPPERPALDALVKAIGLHWDDAQGSYVRPGAAFALTSQTQMPPRRLPTTHTSHRPPPTPESNEAHEFDERIRLAAQRRHFRVIEVTAGYDQLAAEELAGRVGTHVRSLDLELMDEMRQVMKEDGVESEAVFEADREGPAGPHWPVLKMLMQKSAKRLSARLLAATEPLVLTQPGLLARYQLDGFLRELVEGAQRDDAPAVLLIVPTADDPGPAEIDAGVLPKLAIPTTSPGQRLQVPESWIRNVHRGAA